MKKNPSRFRLCCYITSNFVATNNEDFKIFKDMVDFYLRYKKSVVTMQLQSNYAKWGFLKRLENIFSIYI